MDKISVGFLGYGTRALDALMEHEGFEVKRFLAPMSRLCEDVYIAKRRYPDLNFAIVRNNEELLSAFQESEGIDCYVMNACPIILKEDTLAAMPVYNIHPGSLHSNRGHQPHLWTVLLGEPESEIVLHTVTAGIDEGAVIGREVCKVEAGMDAGAALNLLEDQIPQLLDSLYGHVMMGVPPLFLEAGGTYRRVMVHSDYEFSLSDMEQDFFLKDVLRKIRARSMHHGAFFVHKGERIYVDRLLDDETIAPAGHLQGEGREEKKVPFTCSGSDRAPDECLGAKAMRATDVQVSFHGSVVFLEHGGRRLVFRVNKREPKDE